MPFPLPFIPKLSYKTGARWFGANRANGKRLHAGCDLIAPVDTPIFAIADGIVKEANPWHEFFHHTKALVILHGGFIVRYCEVKGFAPGIIKDKKVAAGEVVAYVGRMLTMSMLHFELYAGTLGGPLTVRGNKPFQRRADLMNPTVLLDRLAQSVNQSGRPVEPLVSSDTPIRISR